MLSLVDDQLGYWPHKRMEGNKELENITGTYVVYLHENCISFSNSVAKQKKG